MRWMSGLSDSPLLFYTLVIRFDVINMKIPGLSFSWKRAIGVTAVKQKIARATGVPTTRQGLERKVGALIIGAILGNGKKKRRR